MSSIYQIFLGTHPQTIMPRKSERMLFLEAYEREIENELAELDDELEIEVDFMSINSEIESDSSLSSLSSLSFLQYLHLRHRHPLLQLTPMQKQATLMTPIFLMTSSLES